MTLILKKRRLLNSLALAFVIALLVSLAFSADLLHGLQQRSSDLLFRAAYLYSNTDLAGEITLITIDDKSLDELGRFASWPRSYHARLIERLSGVQARIIVFDILFSEPTAQDEELAAAIKSAGNVILPLAYTVTTEKPSLAGETTFLGKMVMPLPELAGAALAMGHANMLPDEDGVLRKVPLLIPSRDQFQPALALTAAAKYLRRSQIIESPPEEGILGFAGRSIPLSQDNNMLINFLDQSSAPLSFPKISYADALKDSTDLSEFQDKIVLIGVTGTGMGDTFWTPMGQMVYGVELHAWAMHTILAANFLRPAPSPFTVIAIFFLALLCALILLRFRLLWAVLSTLGLIAVYFLIASSLFDRGIIMNMIYPPLATASVFAGLNVYHLVAERTEKKEITKTFGRYVSPSVAERILVASEENKLKLGGEEVEVTTLFADARSFTHLSESLPTPEVVRVLNRHLSLIIQAVLKYEGMINKFGGDSILAVWNVPIATGEHALKAIKAAVNAQQAIRDLQAKEPSLPRLHFGIGINTGMVVAGNMGSTDRLEYSVIGDTVNTAARLATLAPGGKIWVGAGTFLPAKDKIKATPLAPINIKGKQEPVQVYEITGVDGE